MRADADLAAVVAPWARSGRVAAATMSASPGPVLVVVGALHGNEPAGVAAGERVVAHLERSGRPRAGAILVVAGNQGAMRVGRRFVDRDLNRRWHDRSIARLRELSPLELCREDREQLDLVALFEAILATGRDAICLDLHSTSGASAPFSVIVDAAANRELARALELPSVLGFERHVDAPILTWWQSRGRRAVGVEGGRHDDPETTHHLAAVIWQAAFATGIATADQAPGHPPVRYGLRADVRGIPKVVRIVHRHGVVPDSGFRMEPGLSSFEPVTVGQLLAHDRTGAIRAPCEGMIFLPRYQDQGGDGFFIVREEA